MNQFCKVPLDSFDLWRCLRGAPVDFPDIFDRTRIVASIEFSKEWVRSQMPSVDDSTRSVQNVSLRTAICVISIEV